MMPDAARKSQELVRAVYEASYVAAIASGDPFDSPNTFMDRFEHYVRIDGFSMFVAYLDDAPVGQTWGWPLPSNTTWWNGLLSAVPDGFTSETGLRTFALSEIMVAEQLAGKGIARRLHDNLIRLRTEERGTLLVEPDNEQARRAYASWGWEFVSKLRPGWEDAPLFDVMIRSPLVT